MAVVWTLSSPFPARARQVFDPADPAFASSITVTLPPPAPAPPLGASDEVYEFESAGVTFRFESLTGVPLDGSGFGSGPGIVVFGFGSSGPAVVLNVSPPVPVIGFTGLGLDGCPGADFIGSSGTEGIRLGPCSGSDPAFYGAADIGDIGVVNHENPANVFLVTSMTFVPPTSVPTEIADLDLQKTESRPHPGLAGNGEALTYALDLANLGPDNASDVLVTDFLPNDVAFNAASAGGAYEPGMDTVSWQATLAAGSMTNFQIDAMTPAEPSQFHCDFRLTNVAVASAGTPDPMLGNNLSTTTTFFDNLALADMPEICGDGIDNNCDGRVDCGDPLSCDCRPTLPPGPGGNQECFLGLIQAAPGVPPILVNTCVPSENDADNHQCRVPRGACGERVLPSYCCDPGRLSDPSLANLEALRACNVGIPGCAPVDPNFKESIPPVNLSGFGYAQAGETMSYSIHYENVGNADALDVKVIDVLDPDLDDGTLVIQDGGVYDPTTRTLVWTDAVVPPSQPRSVSFEIDVRSDAPPGTRARNDATIIFPNAVPPSRIDTNFVEHVVPEPRFPIEPILSLRGCSEADPAGGLWHVDLVNDGLGFAYNVTATILGAPAGVSVTDADAGFAHVDDEDPSVLATVIPNATSTSRDTVAFQGASSAETCASFHWRIQWENLRGDLFATDIPPTIGECTPGPDDDDGSDDESSDDDSGKKLKVCHVPPGNPARSRTLRVSASAWPAHAAHGDTCGPCR